MGASRKGTRSPWLKEISSPKEILEKAINELNIDRLIKEGIPLSRIAESLEAKCHEIYLQQERRVREKWLPKLKAEEIRVFETSLANSARARAGSTVELIIRFMLKKLNIPFESRKFIDGEQPDIIIPDVDTLKKDPSKATILSIKREVRERWRVSVGEAYILREVYKVKDNYWFVSLGHDIDEYICNIMSKLKIRVYVLNSLYEKFKHIEGVRPLTKLFDDLSHYRKKQS